MTDAWSTTMRLCTRGKGGGGVSFPMALGSVLILFGCFALLAQSGNFVEYRLMRNLKHHGVDGWFCTREWGTFVDGFGQHLAISQLENVDEIRQRFLMGRTAAGAVCLVSVTAMA